MKKLIPYSQLKTKPTKLSHFFEIKERWTTGHAWRNENGDHCYHFNKETVCKVCLLGAIIYMENGDPDFYEINSDTAKKLVNLIKKNFPKRFPLIGCRDDVDTIWRFNDRIATFEDIQKIAKLYDEAA